MKVLVTGGTGFLGKHLVPKLLEDGHSVRLLSRSSPSALSPDVEWAAGDLKSAEDVRRAVSGVELIYHLAGLVSFSPKDAAKMYELHVHCTQALLKEAKRAKVKRLVLASTSGTIAVSKEARLATESEDYPLAQVGRWPYYLSKIYEEKIALEYCRKEKLPLIVLNPSLLLGPGDDRLSSTWMVVKFLNRDIPTMPNGGLSFVDVRDAASVFARVAVDGEVYGRHLFGVNMSFREFFGRLERLSGVGAPKLRLPSKANVVGARLLEKWAELRGTEPVLEPVSVEMGEHFFYLDASKAERELGFRPRDVHETLFDTLQFIFSQMAPGTLPGTKGKLARLRSA